MKIVWGIVAIVYGLFLFGLYERLISAGAAAAYPITKRIPGGVGVLLGVIVAVIVYFALAVLVLAVGRFLVVRVFAAR